MDGTVAESWPKRIGAITLFVEDLAAAREFYLDVFGLPAMFEDADSAVFDFGNTVVNLLRTTAVPELISPAVLAPPDAGSRHQLTIDVDDVDAVCARLADRGVPLLNGPIDRPWGVRTASFVDPGGHIWEVAR
jgi:catechol 2,3-dioxygenase-like lactoylglutathione lyase family enzyme